MNVCFTGHRPKKFGGYDETLDSVLYVKDKLEKVISMYMDKYKDIIFICGGALGVDTWAASVVLSKGGRLHQYLPYKNYMNKWPKESVKILEEINFKAEKVEYIVNDFLYKKYQIFDALEQRNRAMVDAADEVISVFWGGHGGTRNCILYALSQKKTVMNINRPK